MKRKVLSWELVERRDWYPKLECGHDPCSRHDNYDGFSDEEKLANESEMSCADCDDELSRAREQLYYARKVIERLGG